MEIDWRNTQTRIFLSQDKKKDILMRSNVRKLQATLFPVQPIYGHISDMLSYQYLQNRYGFSKKDVDQLSTNYFKYRESTESSHIMIDSALNNVDGITQEAARWPTECQVIPERVQHIACVPSTPEPYYVPTGKEPKPKPVSDEYGIVVFNYCPMGATNYFSRSCAGGNTVFPESKNTIAVDDSQQSDQIPLGTDLNFESRFESGNLGKVIKITDTYYQLHLRQDLYTQRHSQWYYFRISNTRSGTLYRLSIVNLCKDDSLYNEGLRPLLYSTKDASMYATGWRRCGENITYYKNDSSDEEKERHTLTFNLNFPHDKDVVYLAHCYPYTYTDLQEYLSKLVNDPVKTKFTKLRLLCRSLAGNGVYYLTITEPSFNNATHKKKGVVVTARVHPGETPSSWIMKGIIDFLTGETNQAQELRKKFIFKLVPMLNPDGVIVGNNRCSLSGKDLNRQYRTVMRESYPSVWHTKLMIRRLMEECGIALYCDLHAHSRKHNIFIYGCETKRGCTAKLSEQVFPLMLHKNAADKFSFESCKFHIEKSKEGTGRVVVWLMGIQNSYTMEASLGGSKVGWRAGTHFSTQDYEHIGKSFCETLLDFSDDDPMKAIVTQERLRNKIIARLIKEGSSADEPTNINLTDYSSDEGDTSDSSFDEYTVESREISHSAEISNSNRYIKMYPSNSFLQTEIVSTKKCKKVKKLLPHKNITARRKLLTSRTTMELPTTDPGSDLCDLSDSADENFFHSLNEDVKEKALYRIWKETSSQQCKKEGQRSHNELMVQLLPLPSTIKPRSLSANESLTFHKTTQKHKHNLHRYRLPRTLQNLSPMVPENQDINMKSRLLQQKIWTGISFDNKDKNNFKISSTKCPLSWGLSSTTFSYTTDNKIKEMYLEKLGIQGDTMKSDKKKQKKKYKIPSKMINITPVENTSMKCNQKSIKQKKNYPKHRKVLNINIDSKHSTTVTTNITDDSLRLFGLTKLSNVQNAENKKKYQNKDYNISASSVNNYIQFKSTENMIDKGSVSEGEFIQTKNIKQKYYTMEKKSATKPRFPKVKREVK